VLAKKIKLTVIPCIIFFIAPLLLDAEASYLRLIGSVNLPGIEGRIDHMDHDATRGRLFIAAHDANRLVVVDIKRGTIISAITGLKEPQGVLYIPEFDRVFVTNGGDGSLMIFEGSSLALRKTIHLNDDADNLRYVRGSEFAYAGHGNGAIGIIHIRDEKLLNDIPLDGHPESFCIDNSKQLIYANVPSAGEIEVISLKKHQVVKKWKLRGIRGNYPLAINVPGRELFVGCRKPSRILVVNTETGETLQTLDITDDVDDIFYNQVSRLIYASCGRGYIHVFRQESAHRYSMVSTIKSGTGARTSMYVPGESRLFVAVPGNKTRGAHILVFDTIQSAIAP
jgi:hypothetical protein